MREKVVRYRTSIRTTFLWTVAFYALLLSTKPRFLHSVNHIAHKDTERANLPKLVTRVRLPSAAFFLNYFSIKIKELVIVVQSTRKWSEVVPIFGPPGFFGGDN